ncbi:hypothetical protein H4219_006216, partial [Mycoemilia scoparia]
MLVERLQKDGINAKLLKFPDRTTAVGKMIHSYLAEGKDLSLQAIHLLFSANRWEAMDEMKRLLKEGTVLVVDRYAYSGVAYTSAKGLSMDWCKQSDAGLLKPDVVFYLDLDPRLASNRGEYGAERYENIDLQTKIIDASLQVDEIHNTVFDSAIKTILNIEDKKFESNLW